jgi:autotransporter translocation and assembly factor TamB
LRGLLRVGLLAATLLSLLLLLAPFTVPGTRLLLQLVSRFTPVQIEHSQGSLFGHLRLASVELALPALNLKLVDVQSALTVGCLWQSRLCLEYLRAEAIDIQLAPADGTTPKEEPVGDEMLVFPVTLTVAELALTTLRVGWTGGEWQSDLRGRVDLAESRLTLSDLRMAAGSLLLAEEPASPAQPAPAQTSAGAVPATGRIDPGAVFLPFALVIDDLQMEQLDLAFTGQRQQYRELLLAGEWKGHALQLDRLAVARADWGKVALAGDVAFRDEWPLSLTADLALARPPVPARLQQRDITVSATGSLGALAIAMEMRGEENVKVDADVDVLDRELPFLLQAEGRWSPDLRLSDWLELPPDTPPVDLVSPLQLRATGTLQRQRFEVQAAASGLGYEEMHLAARGSHGDATLELDELVLADSSANALTLEGWLRYGDGLAWDLEVASTGFDLPAYPSIPGGRLGGDLASSGKLAGEDWQIALREVDIRGEVGGLPAVIEGRAGLARGLVISASDLRADINGALVNLSAPPGGAGGSGAKLKVTIDDLGRWLPGGSGRVNMQAALSGDSERLQLTAEAADVAAAGVEFSAASLAGGFRVSSARVTDLEVSVNELEAGQLKFEQIRLTGSGDQSNQRFELVSRGDVDGRLAVAGVLQEQGWRGVLEPASLETPLGPWQLSQPVALHWRRSDQTLALDAHCWSQDRTRLCPGEVIIADEGGASLRLEGPADYLNGLLSPDMAVTTTLALDAHAAWTPQGLTLNGTALSPGGVFRRDSGAERVASAEWQRVAAEFRFSEGALQLDADLALFGGKALLALALPAAQEESLAGELRLEQLQLAGLSAFLPGIEELGGAVNGQIKLSGSAMKPLATGALTLAQGRLRPVDNPTALDELAVQLTLHGTDADLKGDALLGGGPLTLAGKLSWLDEPRLEVTVEGQKQNLLRPPSLQMTVSERLQLVATPQLVDVRGEINVSDGKFEFDELPAGSVDLSGDVVIVDYQGGAAKAEQPIAVQLDVRVTINDRFRIAGSTLNANVGGKLNLVQRPQLPLELFGNLNVMGGELEVYGQRLLVRRGTVSFTGPAESPELNLRAEREIPADNVTVGVSVLGPANALQLEVYSDPIMPQTEALSYLARGRGLDSGAGGGVDATALAISMGMGAINRSSVVSGLERLPGVSNIEFGTGRVEDDTTATVSGYLGERIYLSYGVGLNVPVSVLTGRLYLRTQLWLEMISALENSIDLYYSFDID